jgi:hypothetical protein
MSVWKSHYDRRSVGQSVLVSDPHVGTATNFSHSLFDHFRQFLVCWCGGDLSGERTGLYFSVFARYRQRSVSQIWVPRDWWECFIVSIFETPPTWRARSLYLYPPRTGWPSYTPGHWVWGELFAELPLIWLGSHTWRLQYFFPAVGTCLSSRCLATAEGKETHDTGSTKNEATNNYFIASVAENVLKSDCFIRPLLGKYLLSADDSHLETGRH